MTTVSNSLFAQISSFSCKTPTFLDRSLTSSSCHGANTDSNPSLEFKQSDHSDLAGHLNQKTLPTTTMMLKNIPNSITLSGLLQTIRKHFEGVFDLVYLPMDFHVALPDPEQMQPRLRLHKLHQPQSSRALLEGVHRPPVEREVQRKGSCF